MNIPSFFSRLLLLSAAFALASCASYAPPARFSQQLSTIITAEDAVHTTVRSSGGMFETDEQRLAGKITTQARTLALSNGAKGKSFEIVVDITRYQRGNTAARAFLPGMGDLIIEGIVSVYQVPSNLRVGEFTVSKSFGAPGLYGLVTSMDTIENAFAQGVAQTVTGRK
ncbi:MAG: hypothetical protein ACO1TE_00150 [Prosthecobacter sp.]